MLLYEMMTDLSNINYRKCMLNNPMQTLDLLKRKYCMNLEACICRPESL